ncbi:MAG TPA: ATP-grasp domain-containing protein, partial [Pyrinomonadaceae bacterium]
MAAEENLRPNVVCLASYFKGNDFLRECKAQGCRVFLVTREKTLGEDWARESLEDIIVLPDKTTPEIFIRAVEELARRVRVDRVVALEEYDVVTAALAREHLCLPGMSGSTARLFRDKLAMRARASGSGIRVPDFVSAINYQAVGEYMKRVPAPWVLKPRSDVSAVGIRKLHHPEEVWRAMEELDRGERQDERSPYYLLERFVPGDVYHVDSMVDGWQVRFAGANKYGRPPMEVAHQGGVFISHTVMHDSEEEKELFNLNRRLIEALGLERGATHAEFIRGAEDGEFYFLEIAARVGGAYIAEVLEAATGLNL